jgi:hypothetical protein
MKTCPSCSKTYEDDSLVFCLDDGARLTRAGVDANATLALPTPGPTVASPRPTPPTGQSTITARPEPFQMAPPQVMTDHPRSESRRGVWPWVFAIVLVLGASGVLIAWLVTRGRGDETSKQPTPTPVQGVLTTPSPVATSETARMSTPEDKPSATPDRPTNQAAKLPSPAPTQERPKLAFAMHNNTSLNGSRITYYQRTSFALCQADCAGNASCKGLTWIRPGAYNPSDPGMCYLMSAVTQLIPSTMCCISAVRN